MIGVVGVGPTYTACVHYLCERAPLLAVLTLQHREFWIPRRCQGMGRASMICSRQIINHKYPARECKNGMEVLRLLSRFSGGTCMGEYLNAARWGDA